LTPSQDFIFIGIRFCIHVGLMLPPPDRIVIKNTIQNQATVSSNVLPSQGILMSLRPVELSCRPNPTREVALSTSSTSPTLQMETASGPLDRDVPLPESLLQEVWKFWGSEARLKREHPPPPQLSMFTDASNFGWGAHVNEADLTTKGTWSQEESKLSINILELIQSCYIVGVKHFRTQLRNQRVSLFSDN
jgi:hypothetical protein